MYELIVDHEAPLSSEYSSGPWPPEATIFNEFVPALQFELTKTSLITGWLFVKITFGQLTVHVPVVYRTRTAKVPAAKFWNSGEACHVAPLLIEYSSEPPDPEAEIKIEPFGFWQLLGGVACTLVIVGAPEAVIVTGFWP